MTTEPKLAPVSIGPASALGGRRPLFFLLASLPLWLAVLIRSFDTEGESGQRPLTTALLLIYLALFATGDWISRRYVWYQDIYFGLQLAIVLAIMVSQPDLDFFPTLLIPVSAQIALAPGRLRRALWFLATLSVMALGMLAFQEFPRSIALILLYAAAYILIASYATVTEDKEHAEAQARALVTELREANQQLVENAATIENLAIVEERNRLARELHDSVSQTLYGLVLSSEAARRNLARGNADSIRNELDAIGEAARGALAEMRLLIYELRPSEIEEHGLQWALEHRLSTVERRAGLRTTLVYDVTSDLPIRTEIELERIAAEALTNVVRHSGASRVHVAVRETDRQLVLEVKDNGVGFEPAATVTGFGLRGMHERAAHLGGSFAVESHANRGTRVRVEAPL